MSGGATVTLTFAGDAAQLDKTLSSVGSSTSKMTEKVRESSKGLEEWEEKAGKGDTRAMGFRDAITGMQDSFKGLTDSSLSLGDRLFTLGAGVGDLFSSFENLLIPAFGKIAPLITEKVVPSVIAFAASVGETLLAPLVAAGSVIFGTVVPAVWSFTAALLANPITWIVIGIVALIAILVLLINHFDLVKAAWTAVTSWIGDRVHDVGAFFSWLADSIPKWLGAAWDWVKSAFWAVVQFHIDAGNKLIDIFKSIGSAILAPFRWAFNEISDAWNKTIGSLSWHVPDWVPFIGGNTISAPRLPHFHTGGVVGGTPGQDVLAVLQAGETVVPRTGSAGGTTNVVFSSDGSAFGDAMVEYIRKAVAKAGGNVQTVLGR
jgi:hypothetical protein